MQHRRRCAPGLAATAMVLLACAEPAPPILPTPILPKATPSTEFESPAPRFVEQAADAGIDFVHQTGFDGSFYPPEIMGPGLALVDLDGDDALDLFFVQGRGFGDPTPASAGGLYLNRSEPGHLRFVDATAGSNLIGRGYGQGVAVGDFDNDGRIDLFLTCHGPNALFRNLGGGRFEDVTGPSAVNCADLDQWSVSATFFDYDRDGWLDLFIANYLEMTAANHRTCRAVTGAQDYCAPTVYGGAADRLLRNRGDGTFLDVTVAAGLAGATGPALGVVAIDVDDDGWLDLYVANDGVANHLWMNQGGGRFEEQALTRGVAVNGDGRPEASMGIAAGDYDGDGDVDLFLSHLTGETNTLYRNRGDGRFDDATVEAGLGPPSRPLTGFGAAWLDVDGDQDLDLAVVNGAVRILPERAAQGDPYPFAQPGQLFVGDGAGRFADRSTGAGPALTDPHIGRGLAVADLDRDGDLDLVVAVTGGPPRLLVNQSARHGHWLDLRIVDGTGRDAAGARVTVLSEGGRRQRRWVHSDGSYASATDPRLLVHIGAAAVAVVEVRWPDGTADTFVDVPADQTTVLAPRRP